MLISQPNQVRSSQNFQWNFLWVSHYDKTKKQTKHINKQTNKHFKILYISAKSSQIFTKFSGYISVGVPRWLKYRISTKFSGEISVGVQKRFKKKQIYKQTNKQINIFKSYISQPNQVRSSQNVQGNFLWLSQDN